MYSWGNGYLGNGKKSVSDLPVKVTISEAKIVKVAAGDTFMLALDDTGKVWEWGYDELSYGIFPDNKKEVLSPIKVESNRKFIEISSGKEHALAIDENGDVYRWGYAHYGEFGERLQMSILPELSFGMESNTSLQTARELSFDSNEGAICTAGEYRYYKFVPKETKYYEFETITNTGIDTYGYLYDVNGNQISYNDDGNAKGESINNRDFYIKEKLESGETYYIGVRMFGSKAIGCFDLRCRYYDDCVNDIAYYKGNNTNKQLKYNSGSNDIDGELEYKKDIDVIEYETNHDGFIIVESISDRIDLVGEILDEEGNCLKKNDDSPSNVVRKSENARDFYIKLSVNKNTKYFIKINSYASSYQGKYTINVINDDYENDFASSYDINSKDSIEGTIDYEDDLDTFIFEPSETKEYVIESESNIDLYGYLYDEDGNIIAKNDDGNKKGCSDNSRDFYIRETLNAGDTYYIKVKGYNSLVRGNYVLYVKEYVYCKYVNNYYDQAHELRYGVDGIEVANLQVATLLEKLFDINYVLGAKQEIESLPEKCIKSRGMLITSENIEKQCEEHSPSCTDWHEIYKDFIANYPGNTTTTSILWTGHKLFLDGKPYNRSYKWYNNGICMQSIYNKATYYKQVVPVLLHEISHTIGAPDHYHELLKDGTCRGKNMCKVCNPVSGRSADCIMCNTHDSEIMNRNIETIYCQECKNEIKEYLKEYY